MLLLLDASIALNRQERRTAADLPFSAEASEFPRTSQPMRPLPANVTGPTERRAIKAGASEAESHTHTMSAITLIPFFTCPDSASPLNTTLTELDRSMVPWNHPQEPLFADEATRLLSFDHWFFASDKSAADLAAAGLYFLGTYHGTWAAIHDITRCFHCGTVFGCWMTEDDVLLLHLERRPDCLFARRQAATSQPDNESLRRMWNRWLVTAPCQDLLKAGLNSCLLDPVFKDIYSNGLDFPKDLVSLYRMVADVNEREIRDFRADPDSIKCLTCTNQAIVLLTPCSHVIYCLSCSRSAEKCAVCRMNVTGRVIVRLC